MGKSVMIKKYLGAVALNHITRLAFGKRFLNAEGMMDEEGVEFEIVANGLKLGSLSPAMAEYIPWLRWIFPLEKAIVKFGVHHDKFTRAIMEEHTQACKKSGGAKHHFLDALLTMQGKYDLSEDTIVVLLWDS
ncbi:hypothetical protein RJT34_21793 [Clitoria ternatea]|uniref:Uncharacterized protein n=1 Tax=Clitoria ternatea TaxID=43366 RepID=A0AAN9IVE7_CLITE